MALGGTYRKCIRAQGRCPYPRTRQAAEPERPPTRESWGVLQEAAVPGQLWWLPLVPGKGLQGLLAAGRARGGPGRAGVQQVEEQG